MMTHIFHILKEGQVSQNKIKVIYTTTNLSKFYEYLFGNSSYIDSGEIIQINKNIDVFIFGKNIHFINLDSLPEYDFDKTNECINDYICNFVVWTDDCPPKIIIQFTNKTLFDSFVRLNSVGYEYFVCDDNSEIILTKIAPLKSTIYWQNIEYYSVGENPCRIL